MEVGGVAAHVGNVGIKNDQLDFLLAALPEHTTAAGVFTRSAFAGPSVTLSREVVDTGSARGLVVVSKNANVANGPDGDADAAELRARAAEVVGCAPGEVVVASTGVIGQRYPTARLWSYLDALRWPDASGATLTDAARAIMTTDTVAKVAEATAGDAHVVGIAKGVGMIEPDMATLLVFAFTDAKVTAADLDAMWRRVTDVTFNAMSIDTDTSTSDTAVVFATGAAGPVPPADLETTLHDVCLRLVRMITADGEGASKSIVVDVTGAAALDQARRVAKSIVNSPLVKTAVHGADPNWGRLAMAVGKVDDPTIDAGRVRLGIGDVELYPTRSESALDAAAAHLRGDDVRLWADLGLGDESFSAYGCDLTEGYIRINADYTT